MRTQALGRTLSTGSALLLSLLLVLSVACGSDEASDPVTVIRSEDGATTITIPEGALPEGVSPEDLTIAALPIDGDEAETTLVALELGPSGVVFEEPVRLTFEIDIPEGGATTFWLLPDEGDAPGESIPVESIIRLPSDGSGHGPTRVQVLLPHFSRFAGLWSPAGNVSTRLSAPTTDRFRVGEEFWVTFDVKVESATNSWKFGGRTVRQAATGKPWRMAGHFILDGAAVERLEGGYSGEVEVPRRAFTDSEAEADRAGKRVDHPSGEITGFEAVVPGPRDYAYGDIGQTEVRLVCIESGAFRLSFQAHVAAEVHQENLRGSTIVSTERTEAYFAGTFLTWDAECIDDPTSPTPSPTTSDPTLEPTTAAGILPGDYLVAIAYTNGTGSCGYESSFDDELFLSITRDFEVTFTQPSTGDMNIGTIDPVTGQFVASQDSPPEKYEGVLDPVTGVGEGLNTYTDSGGCTSTWEITWSELQGGVACVEALGRRECSYVGG